MRRKSFGNMQCPIARSLERVGEWWSILILRDAFYGLTRFDEFQKSLGIAPNMLTRRLNALVEAGLLERRRYSERPPRDEYRADRARPRLPAGAAGLPGLGQPALRARGGERACSSTARPGCRPTRSWSTGDRPAARRRRASSWRPGPPRASARGSACERVRADAATAKEEAS